MQARKLNLRCDRGTRSPFADHIMSELLILFLRNDFCCGHDDFGSGDEDDDDDSRLIFYATFPSHMPLPTVLHFTWYLSFLFMYIIYHHYRIDNLILLIPSTGYYYYYYYYYYMDVSCHRPFLPGTSLEPAVIHIAQASSFTLQYFPYCV